MSKNLGKSAHEHALSALELLLDYRWDMDLTSSVREHLHQSAELLEQHIRTVKCPCGDKSEDVHFYRQLCDEVEWVLAQNHLAPLPEVQESLQDFFTSKGTRHRCIHALKEQKYPWLDDLNNSTGA